MQREIANVAAHCALQGFRYMAFPPLVFEEPQVKAAAAATDDIAQDPSREVPDAVPPVAAKASGARMLLALLDDVAAPTKVSLPASAARPLRDTGTRRPRREPSPQIRHGEMGTARADRPPQTARPERNPPPARAERNPPPARAERATRYALLRELSDDQH